MGLSTYVFLLFGISVAFYFLGSTPLLFSTLGCSTAGPSASCEAGKDVGYTVITNIINAIKGNPVTTGLIGITIISSLLLGGTFIVVYVVPILILIAVADFFLLPTDFIFSDALPIEIRIVVFGFMNLMLVMTIVGFIRGGE
jgi:hypothetical protein